MTTTQPANVLKFPGLVDLQLELGTKTVKRIEQLAVEFGCSFDQVIEEALVAYELEIELADTLKAHLETLLEEATNRPRRRAIEKWQYVVRQRLHELTSPAKPK